MEQSRKTKTASSVFGGIIVCLLTALAVGVALSIGQRGDLIGLGIGVVAGTFYTWRTLHPNPRTLPGHCSKCGYDLTGNESGVCPECGSVTKQ